MTVKLFEVRDRGTTMPMMGIAMDPQASNPWSANFRLLRRAGYGARCILFGSCAGGRFCYDPHEHGDSARTRQAAHQYVSANWDKLTSGDIVDVEFILGETTAPKPTDL